MDVELLYFDGCPNHERALAQLRATLGALGDPTSVQLVRVANETEAQAMRFLGSPSIRINGRDVDPGAETRTDFGLQCRVYPAVEGFGGTPPSEWIVAALSAVREEGRSL
jgi:hypothetical protein